MAKILIIDDSEQMTHLLSEMVGLFGHAAEIAHSGEAGLKMVETFQPDLILLDIMMPVMDGWGVLNILRETTSIPVLMISADESASTRRKAAKAKVPLLPKAIEPLLLKDKIESALHESVGA